ncbi:hypothetical protein K3723_14945 [Leisingera caerulea]|uniref:hypothetical protein n=1 Tax=Leisingera caerulea TaxID=506591 RepID=UPI001ADFC6A7|nr:hypothetical protein [Leisingera caerulea]UWQ62128.1 hypothetical protein K3723_14945 [Leisingera caerulea]
MRHALAQMRTLGKKHFRKIKNVFVMRLLPRIIPVRPDESARRLLSGALDTGMPRLTRLRTPEEKPRQHTRQKWQ